MKIGELRALTDEELLAREADLRRQAQEHRFSLQSGQLENTNQLRGARREIARILTLLRERKAGAQARPAQGK